MPPDVIAQFLAKYESLAGGAHRASSPEEAAGIVVSVLKTTDATAVALGDLPDDLMLAVEKACEAGETAVLKPPYDSAGLPDSIEACGLGVSFAAFAVADAGAMVELTTDDAIRLVSTLPRTHVGFVPAAEVRASLEEAAGPIRDFYNAHPEDAAATFISGPSRTGDIEMRLTLGVHGPEASHVVVVDW
jgi:L-lactate dehydrogenase complex protein LldG